MIPVQFVLFTLSAIIGSAILYGDFQKAKFHQIVTFLYGCAATFVGVFTIAWTPVDVDPGISGTEDDVRGPEESGMTPNASQGIHDGAPLGLGTIGKRKRGALVLPSGVTGPKDTPTLRHKRGGVAVMGISPAQVKICSNSGYFSYSSFINYHLAFTIRPHSSPGDSSAKPGRECRCRKGSFARTLGKAPNNEWVWI